MQVTARSFLKRRGQWARGQLQARIKDALGPASRSGMAYRWGVAVATGESCCDLLQITSRYACDVKASKFFDPTGLAPDLNAWLDRLRLGSALAPSDAVMATTLAAALPTLEGILPDEDLFSLVELLLSLHRDAIRHTDPSNVVFLLLGAELGWHLHLLNGGSHQPPTDTAFGESATSGLRQWCEHELESIPSSLQGTKHLRLVLASLVRCKKLGLLRGLDSEQKEPWKRVGKCIATWVLALTRHRGLAGFSSLGADAIKDDRVRDGLLDQAVKFEKEMLANAKSSVLGIKAEESRSVSDGALPPSMLHDLRGKLAVMMPKWSVGRARIHVDYHDEQVRCEIFHGKKPMITGAIKNDLSISGEVQRPIGAWEEVCEYSDEDVHYLEIEQDWSGGAVLQRQFVLMRKDRCVLFADAVIPKKENNDLGEISYQCRLPISDSTSVKQEPDVRELFFAEGNRKSLGIPLAASEWRIGPTSCDWSVSADHHLVLSCSGSGRLYTPIWFDFARRRFARKRTWRQLTVVDQLRIVDRHEAAGYRVQVGSEQWMIYRSLYGQRTRTVLGKHLIADFYCAKFDAGSGSFSEIITVDDSEE